ncbi:MAG: cyclopropane-fatty-acyl-phospholipid synthase [Rickettsiales bacterium]|nr:cyclopropane-fatty-acyl-phospholipid synthase [Rickettsiales bacterium]
MKTLQSAPYGTLKLTTPEGEVHHFEGEKEGPSADLHIHHWDTLKQSLWRGDIGFGETYIDGKWTTTDLPELMTYFVHNMEEVSDLCHGTWVTRRLFGIVNWLRRNTKQQSRANIKAHYDVGNSFYSLWLDESMTYSSALFSEGNAMPLQDAQRAKYERIIGKMDKPNAEVLEIGCGWGGFAEEAAKHQHHVTGLTISQEQYNFAQNRMAEQGLDDKVELRMQDYRDVTGLFDYIVSIEMFEAVGEKYWPAYFNTIKQRLQDSGKAIVQTITIDDSLFDDYRQRSDFIRHYTFPGGMLPSVERLKQEVESAGLKCKEVFHFGQDYAETLRRWLHVLDDKVDDIKGLGYSDAFLRSWRFYLSCCIGAFAASRTSVVQVELVHA